MNARAHLVADIHAADATRSARMVTTSAGITIGIAHQAPLPRPGREAERIQTALLEPKTAEPLKPLARVAGAVWRWL